MERKNLAVHGAEAREGGPRVELVLAADGSPELLHPADGGGRFARVIRGFVGSDTLPKPVAVKLERDGEELDPAHGAVKFASEYQAQIRVHDKLKDSANSRVVRLYEIWKSPPGLPCDELPPTIICPRSRQILAPRCPACREFLPDDRVCRNGCPPGSDDATLRVSTCSACAAGSCPAYWLNRRACKILLFELLDLDLNDYLAWRWSRPAEAPTHRHAWAKFNDEHMAAVEARDRRLGRPDDPVMAEFEEWRIILTLFADAVAGVAELHARQIAHLDLKPSNLCLTLDGASARLKVIDLGQADQPTLPWGLRHQSISDDFEANRASGAVFWAAEQMPSRFLPVDVFVQRDGDAFQLKTPIGEVWPCEILPGDYFCFPPTGQFNSFLRVTAGPTKESQLVVTATAGSALPPEPRGRGMWQEVKGGCLVKQAGRSADLFALGLLLLYVIGRGRIDLTPLRNGIDHIGNTLRAKLPAATPLPARAAVTHLTKVADAPTDSVARRLLDALPASGSLREPCTELLGIALRACVRGVPGFSYVSHRGNDNHAPLEQLLADLMAVRNRLVVLAQTHELHSGRIARARESGVRRLREWLAAQPTVPPQGQPPGYDRELIGNTLDLGTQNEPRTEREFRFLLNAYGGVTAWLRADLALFLRELEARHTTARVHPVVVDMFQILGGTSPRAIQRGGESAADAVVFTTRNRFETAKRLLRGPLETLPVLLALEPRAKRLRLTQPVLSRVTAAHGELTRLAAQLREGITALGRWHAAHQQAKRARIAGWQRLELDGAGSWHAFGQSVVRHLAREDRESNGWATRAEQAAAAAEAVADLVRREILLPWPAALKKRRSGLVGLLRRAFASLFGRELSVPLGTPADRLAAVATAATSALGRVRKIGPIPFDRELLRERPRPTPPPPTRDPVKERR